MSYTVAPAHGEFPVALSLTRTAAPVRHTVPATHVQLGASLRLALPGHSLQTPGDSRATSS